MTCAFFFLAHPSVGGLFLYFSDPSCRQSFTMTPLRQRFLQDLQLRNYAPRTIEAYLAGVVRFAKHFQRSPELLGPEQVRDFQLHLLAQHVSWSLFNQVVCALRFFYRVTLG